MTSFLSARRRLRTTVSTTLNVRRRSHVNTAGTVFRSARHRLTYPAPGSRRRSTRGAVTPHRLSSADSPGVDMRSVLELVPESLTAKSGREFLQWYFSTWSQRHGRAATAALLCKIACRYKNLTFLYMENAFNKNDACVHLIIRQRLDWNKHPWCHASSFH